MKKFLDVLEKRKLFQIISCVEKPIGLVIFWEQIVSFIMPLKDRCERSRKKKNTAPWWFEKQKKILGAEGGSWRSKKMEMTADQSNMRKKYIFHKSIDLLISNILIIIIIIIIIIIVFPCCNLPLLETSIFLLFETIFNTIHLEHSKNNENIGITLS